MKLGDVFKLSSGKSLPEKKRTPGNHNVYGGNGITGKHNDYFVEKPTIVIGRVGEYCGAVHLTTEKCWITDNALMVTEWYQEVDKQYLVYVLNAMNLHQYAKTVGQPSISQANVYGLDIDLPLMEQQQEMVKILNLVSKIIIDKKEELKRLDDLIKARFVELFGACDNMISLEKLCSIITDGTHQSPKFQDMGIPFIFVSNLAENKVTYNTEKFISSETYNELIKRTPIEIGDVLLTTVGSYGHPAVIIEDKKFLFQRHIAYLKPRHDIINSFYLHSALLAPDGQRQIEERVKGIAQKTLNLSEIRKIVIPVPDIEQQRNFETFVKEIDKLKFKVQKALDESQLLFDSLMQKYFG